MYNFGRKKMRNGYFQFKKFTVFHDKCAMKVGTDGVLLGAWASHDNPHSILDVGCGCGLIALQMAQKYPDASITAIELDADAAQQATDNINHSAWSHRMKVICEDYTQHQSNQRYDLIVSNPPFFNEGVKSPQVQRNNARHTYTLDFYALLKKSYSLLKDNGRIIVICPATESEVMVKAASEAHLYLTHQLRIYPLPDTPCKRIIWVFEKEKKQTITEELTIELARHQYTPQYIALTKDFYLKM